MGFSLLSAILLLARRARGAAALPGGSTWAGISAEPMNSERAYITASERDRRFGPISYRHEPSTANPERVVITNSFPSQKLMKRHYPQLPGSPTLTIHRDAAQPLADVLEDLERDGELGLIRSNDGIYNPRLVRGSTATLSSHAYGTSIDVNAGENPLSRPPTADQERLARYFEAHGWYWGDRFSRRDPMHFEWIGA